MPAPLVRRPCSAFSPRGVQPLKVTNGSPIEALLNQLRSELDGTPPAWLAKAVGLRESRSPDRFDAMAGEAWEE